MPRSSGTLRIAALVVGVVGLLVLVPALLARHRELARRDEARAARCARGPDKEALRRHPLRTGRDIVRCRWFRNAARHDVRAFLGAPDGRHAAVDRYQLAEGEDIGPIAYILEVAYRGGEVSGVRVTREPV